LAEQVEHIRHWKIQQGDYFLAPDARATWFIDPPYQDQGKQYQHQIDDFDRLASWCRQRQGQVLVCESEGATWLPFEPVTTVVGSTHRKTTEVLWYVENKGADNMSTAKKIEISEEAKSLTAVGSERADSFLELIEDTDLLGEDDYEAAGVMLKDIKRQAKELKNARTEITGPMNQALEATRKLFRAPLKVLDKAERLLKSKMADYTTRLEEEREQALAEAGAASLEGDEDTAVYAMQAAAKAKAPTVAGISMQDVWDYEIEDFDKVPREFLCVDDDLVKAAIKEHKSATNIPGIRVFSKKSVRARA
jgi:hypothetical protein